MGADTVDAVFEHLDRFNATIGPELYPKVIDTGSPYVASSLGEKINASNVEAAQKGS